MAGDDCEECCSILCCSTIGYVCCCRKMKKNAKIKVIWAWLIILATTSGVVLYCAVYSPSERLASPSDMIAIKDHVNFLFCEEIKIKSPGLQFNGYIVPTDDVGIDSHVTKTTNQKTAIFVTGRSYDYFAFYLLEGSRISLASCAKRFMTVYVIIGSKNFNYWKQYQSCDDCYYIKRFINQRTGCTENEYTNIDVYAVINEEYFIIYVNDNYEDLWVDLNVTIERKVYDLNNASNVCTETTECDLFLQGPKQTPVIWIMDFYNLGEHNHPSVSTVCVPRMWAFLVIHGFSILLVGIIATIIVQKTHRYEYDYDRVTERTPLLYNGGLPPSYSTVMRDPPKYEDIIRTCEPPTYTEAVASLQSSPEWETGNNVQNANVQDNQTARVHNTIGHDVRGHREHEDNVRDQNSREHDLTQLIQRDNNAVQDNNVQEHSGNNSIQTNHLNTENAEDYLIVHITNSRPPSSSDNLASPVSFYIEDITITTNSAENNRVSSSPIFCNIESDNVSTNNCLQVATNNVSINNCMM